MPDGNLNPLPFRTDGAAFRTIFTTEARYDAGTAGFDHACAPGEDGGYAVHFDGRGSIPSLIVNGDGEVQIHGLAAIEAFLDAVMDAASRARRMVGA